MDLLANEPRSRWIRSRDGHAGLAVGARGDAREDGRMGPAAEARVRRGDRSSRVAEPTRDELERLVAATTRRWRRATRSDRAAERVEALEAETATRIRAEKDEDRGREDSVLQAEVDAMRDALCDMARYARRMRREEAAKEREKEEEPRPLRPSR